MAKKVSQKATKKVRSVKKKIPTQKVKKEIIKSKGLDRDMFKKTPIYPFNSAFDTLFVHPKVLEELKQMEGWIEAEEFKTVYDYRIAKEQAAEEVAKKFRETGGRF